MHFIDQYKELYPDPVPAEPVVETPPVETEPTAEALRAVKPLPKPAVLPHTTPKHK